MPNGKSTTGFDQQCVDMTVIASFELDNEGPAGDTTSQPDRRHHRFCTGTDERIISMYGLLSRMSLAVCSPSASGRRRRCPGRPHRQSLPGL